ncbi:MAG: hypothetical protein H6779_00690 [Candidatus Nomurabacteria bacterium]|nr:hypothetical protein [Candidatus Nomurabacteria bacterium]USN87947.1 MAG: hypothetical protein H6779_00690 [Candidatus Nomurabacteria bacterium]
MKTVIIVAVLFLCVLGPVYAVDSEIDQKVYLAEMLTTLKEARNGSDVANNIATLENEISAGRLTHEELDSSVEEFVRIKNYICTTEPKILVEIIAKTYQPLNHIHRLSTLLVRCNLNYSTTENDSAKINYYSDIYPHEKRGYMVLALEAINRYKATNLNVYWYEYHKHKRAGGFTDEEFKKFRTVPWDFKNQSL